MSESKTIVSVSCLAGHSLGGTSRFAPEAKSKTYHPPHPYTICRNKEYNCGYVYITIITNCARLQ
jgi:hypothetical protein